MNNCGVMINRFTGEKKPGYKGNLTGRGVGGAVMMRVGAGSAKRLPMCGESDIARVSVEECANLRRDASGRWLVAAGRPARNAKTGRLPVMTWLDSAGCRNGIVKDGGRLRLVCLDGEDPGYDIGGVSGDVKCAVMLGAGRGAVMTDVDCYRLEEREGGWRVTGGHTYPSLRFEAADVMRLSADAEERELSGSYTTRSTVLTDADADRLGKDLLRCYGELADKTTRGGMELQPVLARYRLEGEGGEVLYRSATVQVGAPSGVQCVDELRCELSDDGRRRGTLRVAADVYRLRLRRVTADSVEPGRVKRLVVETSLPVHPVDYGVIAANALGRSGTNGVMLRCFVPGASVTMVSARRHAARRLYEMALKGDAAFREALVVQNPFDGDGEFVVDVPVARGGVQGVEDEIASVKEILGRKVTAVAAEVSGCRVPNRFIADSVCVAGGKVVWGGIRERPFSGYRIEEFATAVTTAGEEHPWRCTVVTELASGARCVATSWGTEGAPLRLSPILCSARGDAVKMTVTLERDGVVYKGEFGLTPDESRTVSYHFSGDGLDTELEATDETFGYVSEVRVDNYRPSGLLVADAVNPGDVSVSATAGTGSIAALVAVDRRGSAWEFGTHRVYVMTGAGIWLLSIGGALRCNRIDRRGVSSRGAVAETDDDRYPVVCVASGDLVGLSRGNVVTLESGAGATKAGWDSVAKELWLAGDDGSARVRQSLTGGWRSVDGLEVHGFHDSGRGLLVDSDLGIRDTARGEGEMAEFAYRLRFDMPALERYRGVSGVKRAGAELHSRNVNGVMRVVSRTIAGSDAGRVAEMEFRGETNAPLLLGLCGSNGAVTEIELRGEMERGSAIREVRLE